MQNETSSPALHAGFKCDMGQSMEAHGVDYRLLQPYYDRLAQGGDRLPFLEWGPVLSGPLPRKTA